MISYDEKKITVPGFNLALKLWYPYNTRPILCLHGKLDSAASFDLLAPYLTQFQLAAVDSPGVGYSSWYPEGVIPHWKNDAFLLLHIIKILAWKQFDIISHSLGSLLATLIAIALPHQVGRVIFLDILGPTVNFIEHGTTYLHRDVETYLACHKNRTVFPDLESAIQDRMKIGNISHQAAEALVRRGTKKCKEGLVWTFDSRLHCVSSTIPYEDELKTMFNSVKVPVCLIRAKQGVPYPQSTFQSRAESIKDLTIYELEGGHHLHMDNPAPVANLIYQFLNN